MNKNLSPEVQERFKRFHAHLPSSDDPTLVVLKGHLLAEEILENLIKSKCRFPEALEGVEIGFFLKAKLARALIGNSHQNGLLLTDSVWGMLEALNSLRNELAHALEPKKIRSKNPEISFVRSETEQKENIKARIQCRSLYSDCWDSFLPSVFRNDSLDW